MNLRRITAMATGAVVLVGITLVSPAVAEPADRPNIVLIVADDMSENLYRYMSEVDLLREQGVTFVNYFNATPWCCPSRATLQTGKYPHNTGVASNGWPNGGFERFMLNDMDSAMGVQLQGLGYRTGFMGKYLNGYEVGGQKRPDLRPDYPANFVPPGWDSWFVGDAYHHFKYKMVVDESDDATPPYTLTVNSTDPDDYYTDVLADHAVEFIDDDSNSPFLLVVNTFAPHSGDSVDPEGRRIEYPAAPRDRPDSKKRLAEWGKPEFKKGDCGPVRCQDVRWPDTSTPGNFNMVQDEPLAWMPTEPLGGAQLRDARAYHFQRIQMLQSVNDMLGDLRAALEDNGKADDTYVIFTSDNGYHLGEHAMTAGKTSAYDHDVKTPLVVYPPGGLETEVTSGALVQNADVLPTLVELAGGIVPSDVDGVSLLALMEQPDLSWRSNVLLELVNDSSDDEGRYRNPDIWGVEERTHAPSYNALRSPEYLYVDFTTMDTEPPEDRQAEFYDLATDPWQMENIYDDLPLARKLELNALLLEQTSCAGEDCRTLQGLQ